MSCLPQECLVSFLAESFLYRLGFHLSTYTTGLVPFSPLITLQQATELQENNEIISQSVTYEHYYHLCHRKKKTLLFRCKLSLNTILTTQNPQCLTYSSSISWILTMC